MVSCYRGCAAAPPPACNPLLLRSFHFAMARRVTGVCLSASRRRFSIRSSLHPCLKSAAPPGLLEIPHACKCQTKRKVKCPAGANAKPKGKLNAQLEQTPKQKESQIPGWGKCQTKRKVKCPAGANAKPKGKLNARLRQTPNQKES